VIISRPLSLFVRSALVACFLMLSGCAASDEARDDEPRRQRVPDGLVLAEDHATVSSVQLHGGTGENALPILQMGSGVPLRLAFDVAGLRGRPLTVTFEHADRNWRRDLSPAETMAIFHRDDILDYRQARGTFSEYVHYEYSFPNSTIDFRISGNYILRVSEQGYEDDVLFERPFFVSEQSTTVDLRMDNVLVAGRQYSSLQPFLRISPENPGANVFDYSVCFVRDALFAAPKCSADPSLEMSPDLLFYLEPRDAFVPRPADYYVNLTDIRTGGRIERINQQRSPWTVTIEPDYADLGPAAGTPFLNGQMRVRDAVGARGEADYEGEYIDTVLRLVPQGNRPAAGRVWVVGTFSGWAVQAKNQLEWNAQEGWYEGRISMKQGQHAYRYVSEDPAFQRVLSSGLPQLENLFTALVYFDDIRTQTDRLVAARGILTR